MNVNKRHGTAAGLGYSLSSSENKTANKEMAFLRFWTSVIADQRTERIVSGTLNAQKTSFTLRKKF